MTFHDINAVLGDDTALGQDTANFEFTRSASCEMYTLDDLAAFVEHARRAGVPGASPVRARTRTWRRRLVELTAGVRVHRAHRGSGRPVLSAAPSPIESEPVVADGRLSG